MLRPLLIAAALLAPVAAAAQDAPGDNAPIVVTGERTDPDEIRSFVDALEPPTGGVQLARFHWAICPRAGGMLPEQAAMVEKRIRTIAKAADIPVAGAKCTPNLLVIVTPDKGVFLDALYKRRPEYFGDLDGRQRRALWDPANPVAAWHVKGEPLNADGQPLVWDSDAGYYVNRTTRPQSRIGFSARPHFAAAIVVIESDALDGLTTIQLADYASMRTLIASDPERLGNSRAPTILRVIDAPMGAEIPITMTSWDLGILKGFYASNPNVSAASQKSETRRRLTNNLEGRGERN